MRDQQTRDRARQLRHRMTDSERRLWRHLRMDQLGCRFHRQHPIGPYIADFACLHPRIVIEVDGSQHAEQCAYDSARDTFIRDQGFIVLRFWSNEVLTKTEAVLQVIWKEVQKAKGLPPSYPSPANAGEGTRD